LISLMPISTPPSIIEPHPVTHRKITTKTSSPVTTEALYPLISPSASQQRSGDTAKVQVGSGGLGSYASPLATRASQLIKSLQMGEFFEEFKDEYLPNRRAVSSTRRILQQPVLHYDPVEDEGFALLSVTIRPRQYWDFGLYVATLYSYVPHLLIPWFLYKIAYMRDLFSLEGLVLMSLVAIVNDIGIKRLYKEPRPLSSRAHGYGMPSSHCACSYATLFWGIYEQWVGRIEPLTVEKRNYLQNHKIPTSLQSQIKPATLNQAAFNTLTLLLLFIPMPWARVKVGDHTVRQSISGCLIGLGVGAFYCFAVLEGGGEWWLTREWFKVTMHNLMESTT